ncbi:MAG: 16S rRNA (cytosine(967)-C(5))-methyltransferase RsmB [Clostridiales Family XIII bacterium]|jgi:16S rRNA (cytosine967-C5)-methyltransferase|nr:16S rRNA (cytosine(967)-C(5))-methyltransferase RsmB [Clostridiales Family XIII bacterium]
MDRNRMSAYYTLMDIENNLAYSNLALKHHIRRGKPDAPAFVREITYGVLKNKIYLDYIIGNFVKTPIAKMRKSELTILRMGLYQLIFMNSVPEYAAVNESVEIAKRFSNGGEGFINGVLRQFLRDKDYVGPPDRNENETQHLSIKYSYAPWIVELWRSSYDAETTEALLAAGNMTPEFSIRVNQTKITREDLLERLNAKGFEVRASARASQGILVKGSNLLEGRLYKNGMFSVQDESSQIAAAMAAPQEGDTIIDVCSAPGGKSLAMAERMNNRGKIYAWDIYHRKLSLIEQEARRLGIDIIETGSWDSTRINSAMVNRADRVFVDAPCSGLGVVRRKPEIKYKENPGELAELPKKQLEILTASANYVKPGGLLVYSTCTISKQENQGVIKRFLRRNRGFEIVDTLQLLPHVDNMDGFFICSMRRTENVLGE